MHAISAFMSETIFESYTNKNVLITGADGFIGSHLTELLVKSGANVTALTLYNSFGTHGWLDYIPDQIHKSVTIYAGDVRDSAQMSRLTRDYDVVFHLAALIGIPYSYEAAHSYIDVNVHGTLNLLEAARSNRVGRLVHTSTSEIYGSAQTRPISETHPIHGQSPYAASKIGADQLSESYARSHNIPVVILRPFNAFGPRQSERAVIPTAIRQILDPACHKIKLGDLSTTRDFNYIHDTVRAFAMIGESNDIEFGTAYNAGSGVETSIHEVIDKLLEITKCDKKIISEKSRVRPKNSEVRALVADASRLKKATGWTCETTLEDGIHKTIDWWRNHFANGLVRRNKSFSI